MANLNSTIEKMSPQDTLSFARKEMEEIVKLLADSQGDNLMNEAKDTFRYLVSCEKEYGDLTGLTEDLAKKIKLVYYEINSYFKRLKPESKDTLQRIISQFRLRSSLERTSGRLLFQVQELDSEIKGWKAEIMKERSIQEFASLLDDIQNKETKSSFSLRGTQEKISRDASQLQNDLENLLSIEKDPVKREKLFIQIPEYAVKALNPQGETSVWTEGRNDETMKNPNHYICAQTISTYPSIGGKREGDPICDMYAITRWDNRIIATVADGCSWGDEPMEAARKVSRMYVGYMKKNHNSIESTRDAARMIFRAFSVCHQSIIYDRTEENLFIAGTSTIIAGVVLELKEAVDGHQYILVCASIGDCKGYIFSQKTQQAHEITVGNRGNHDPRDPGGRLGPTLEAGAPDLRNLSLYSQLCDKGDLIFFVSDGIHDNLDPRQLGQTPSELGFEGNDWEAYKDSTPVELENRINEEINSKLNKILKEAKPLDPKKVVEGLVGHAKQVTQNIRTFSVENPAKRVPLDYKLYPGKLDHTTCLCFTVGVVSPPTTQDLDLQSPPKAVEDVRHRLFGSEKVISWLKFLEFLGEASEEDKNGLKTILDFHDKGWIDVQAFEIFLKGFGTDPKLALQNVKKLVKAEWFQGYVSSQESQTLLQSEPPGTFLVRLSESKIGSFALDYVEESKQVKKVRLEVSETGGWISGKDPKKYQTINEIIDIQKSNRVLKGAFISPLLKKPWFYGNISSQDAEHALRGHPAGTFMIRFATNQSGCYAANFTDETGAVKKGLIRPCEDNQFQVEGQGIKFKTLDDLVAFYKSKGLFVQPYLNSRK